jgi:hypothetical protein
MYCRSKVAGALALAALAMASCSRNDSEPPRTLARTTGAPVAGPVDGSAALTQAGVTLRFGEQAVVSYQALNSGPDATKLEITVTEVAKGSLDDLRSERFELGEDVPGNTPWYVRSRFINRGPGDITAVPNLDTGIMLLDAGGKPVKPAVFTGLFDLDVCERDGLLPPWKPGATSAACTVFLLPDGTEPAGVTFPVVTTKFDSTSTRDRVSWQR